MADLALKVSGLTKSYGNKTLKKTLIILLVIAVIFVFSIFVTPYLIELGRPKKNY